MQSLLSLHRVLRPCLLIPSSSSFILASMLLYNVDRFVPSFLFCVRL